MPSRLSKAEIINRELDRVEGSVPRILDVLFTHFPFDIALPDTDLTQSQLVAIAQAAEAKQEEIQATENGEIVAKRGELDFILAGLPAIFDLRERLTRAIIAKRPSERIISSKRRPAQPRSDSRAQL